ncbi:hypothetical protein [Herbaspirillum sp. SJZ107]|uniref:hypothetical protein n=1 Tax=Herbaspirillum sp. SJZ107 TaxID=2572881 RepID=UPI00115366F6|nr:hypothetical protein [Herbaspirillum sp. SJZ107]TQK04856.1 hypothetical protein FBX97_3818 [Herbaspirillum sp. SJZ107]
MNLLLAFAPFIVFVVAERLAGIAAGLGAAAAVSAYLLIRDLLTPGRGIKLLELGTFFLFGLLTLYALAMHPQWPIAAVRLRVDAGLMLIVLASMVLRQPFSLQYAREQVAREHWDSPAFLRVNYVISAAWAAAFGVLVLADLMMVYVPALPHAGSLVATVAALAAAAWFTGWYPAQRRHMPTHT